MNSAHPQQTLFARDQQTRVTPHVKSAETCELFNGGVSGSAGSAKSADPSCYTSPVSLGKADPAAATAGLFDNQIGRDMKND